MKCQCVEQNSANRQVNKALVLLIIAAAYLPASSVRAGDTCNTEGSWAYSAAMARDKSVPPVDVDQLARESNLGPLLPSALAIDDLVYQMISESPTALAVIAKQVCREDGP